MTARLPAGAARISMVYDAAGQLTGQSALEAGGSYANRFTYSYDNASRRSGVLYLDGSRATYGYDPAGQLIREQRNGAQSANATFTYDAAGNRTLLIDAGAQTTSTYDAANQQLLDVSPTGRTTYGYDNAGNRTLLEAPASSTYYTWDVLSRLTQDQPDRGAGDAQLRRRQPPRAPRNTDTNAPLCLRFHDLRLGRLQSMDLQGRGAPRATATRDGPRGPRGGRAGRAPRAPTT